MKPLPDDNVTLTLSKAEAIVLVEFLMRYRDNGELSIKCEADQQILYDLCALLENEIPELFDPKWNEILKEAQERVRIGEESYE